LRKWEAFTKSNIRGKTDISTDLLVWVYDIHIQTLWMSSYQLMKPHWQFSFPGIFEAVVVNITLDFTMMCAPHPQIVWFIFIFV